jgi:signal transduction histidine kinase/ActR/RegA family two-component response regulator
VPDISTDTTPPQRGWRQWLRRADPSVLAEQLSVNFGNYVFNSAVALFIVLYLYGSAASLPAGWLVHAWTAAMCVYLILRMVSGLLYPHRRKPEESTLKRWETLMLINQGFYGFMMVVLALFLYPGLDPFAQSVVLIGSLVLLGSTAFSLSGHIKAMALSGPPAYLAFAWSAWHQDSPYAAGLSGLILALLGLYVIYALKHRRSLERGYAAAVQIGQLAQELQAKNAQLQELAAGRGRLLATVSHDLRQPAHAMGLLTERALLEPANEAFKATLRDLNDLSQSLSASLATLMDLTRLDAGLVQARPVAMPLGPLLKRLSLEYAPIAHNKGLHLDMAVSSAWVHSDPVLLQAMLGNLLANALKYTGQGRVEVVVTTPGQTVQIAISDTGIGIQGEQLDLIFREFVRLDGSAPGSEGMGLGLAIVRRYAALLGHRMEVKSQAGLGSCFTVVMPASAPDARAAAQATFAESEDQRLQGLKVLVVDNVELLLNSMERTLRSWGCEVGTALSMRQALDWPGPGWPDLIISDFHLGDREPDGLMLIDALRRHRTDSLTIPAILMTGDVAPELEASARLAQVQVLHKPVRPAVLQRAVLDLIERSGLRAEPPAPGQ